MVEDYLDNRFTVLLDPTSIAESSNDSNHHLGRETCLDSSEGEGRRSLPRDQASGLERALSPEIYTPDPPSISPSPKPSDMNDAGSEDHRPRRRSDAATTVSFLDPRKLIKADSFPLRSLQSTLDYPTADAPSGPDPEDVGRISRTSTAPRLGNTYDQASKRANAEDSHSFKHTRRGRRPSSRFSNGDRDFAGLYMGRVALSIEPRLARHFPCRLPPAPAPSTRRVSNLLAVPPAALIRRTPSDKEQEAAPFQEAVGSKRDEIKLNDIASSSIMAARDDGRSKEPGSSNLCKESEDGEHGSEGDWEGLEMGFWKDG